MKVIVPTNASSFPGKAAPHHLIVALGAVLIALGLALGGCGDESSAKDMVAPASTLGVVASPQQSTTSGTRVIATSTTFESTTTSAAPESSAIPWDKASDHVGETVTLEGPVKGCKYAESSNGSPTFLNIGRDYPEPGRLTVLIWEGNRDSFASAPEQMYAGRTIRVQGEVSMYNGAAQVEVSDPSSVLKTTAQPASR